MKPNDPRLGSPIQASDSGQLFNQISESGPVLTLKDAAARLSISTACVNKLAASGLLTAVPFAHLVTFAEHSTEDFNGIDRLLAREPVDMSTPAVVVRLAAPIGPKPRGRDKPGWHENWSPSEKRATAEKWWPVRLDDGIERTLLLAEVSDWIVGAWRIRGKRRGVESPSWRFDLDEDNQSLLDEYYLKRLTLGRGRDALTLPR